MSEELIRIEALCCQFGRHMALNGIDLSIPAGTFTTLVGPDGAGKTTFLRLLAALLLPTKGTIQVAGFNTRTEGDKIQELIGYMPQRFGLYEDLTVQENLTLYADLKGVEKKIRQEQFAKLLHMTQLTPFTKRLAGHLSGGMKQKLGLACALLKEPKLLLLDEPSVGVDPISRRELWKMVQEFHKKGVTILWSTSYLNEAERGDRILLLHMGKLLYQGEAHYLAERAKGRVFQIRQTAVGKRAALFELLAQKEEVMDGKIEGEHVRILTREPVPPQRKNGWIPTQPSIEEGFIDLLGGGPGGNSPLRAHSSLGVNRPLVTQELAFGPRQSAENRSEERGTVYTHREIVIEAQGLTKQFGAFTAVNNVSFQVMQGEVFGLLGPNGAGKSTIFRMLCGLLQPTSGKAIVNRVSLESAPSEARSQIGYMAQKFALYGDLSTQQNLHFFSGIYPIYGQKRKEAIDEMIEIFKLGPYLSLSAQELPIGFKQRLALACALMHRPAVLFLDEPTSGVDPITRREFWNHINALAELGCTILVTTHFMDEADYCDRIALVYQSAIIHMGTPAQLKVAANVATLEEAFIYLIEQQELTS